MCACVLVVIVALSGFSFAIVQNYEVPFVSKLYFKTNNKLFKNDSYVGNKWLGYLPYSYTLGIY